MIQMIAQEVYDDAKKAVLNALSSIAGWDGSAIRIKTGSHSWVSSKENPFDMDEFMIVLDIEVEGETYTLYHTPGTGKYNESS